MVENRFRAHNAPSVYAYNVRANSNPLTLINTHSVRTMALPERLSNNFDFARMYWNNRLCDMKVPYHGPHNVQSTGVYVCACAIHMKSSAPGPQPPQIYKACLSVESAPLLANICQCRSGAALRCNLLKTVDFVRVNCTMHRWSRSPLQVYHVRCRWHCLRANTAIKIDFRARSHDLMDFGYWVERNFNFPGATEKCTHYRLSICMHILNSKLHSMFSAN